MSLVTSKHLSDLLANGCIKEAGKDYKPVVKLFLPGTGFTWLLTEIDPMDRSIAFGLCDLGMGFPELGCVCLEELAAIRTNYGRIEYDRNFEAKFPISVYARAASIKRQITEDEEFLQRVSNSKNSL